MVKKNFATFNHNRFSNHFTDQILSRHIQPLNLRFHQLLNGQLGNLLAFNNNLLATNLDIGCSTAAKELLVIKANLEAILMDTISTTCIITIQNILLREAECLQ